MMTQTMQSPAETFVDRRSYASEHPVPLNERRQFADSHEGISMDAMELANAIDQYKLVHRRRFITYEEMLPLLR